MMLSDFVKISVHQLVKGKELKTFIAPIEIDVLRSRALLKDFGINEENVMRYLRTKYVPKKEVNTIYFPTSKCIQFASCERDLHLEMEVKNSEPHKLITDIFYCKQLLPKTNNRVILTVEHLKFSPIDVLIYSACLEKWNFDIPPEALQEVEKLLKKYPTPEAARAIKKRSIRRKYLRYFMVKGQLTETKFKEFVKE